METSSLDLLEYADLKAIIGRQISSSPARRILEELSFEIATPDEAREMLQMKGADKTSF